MSLSHWTQAGCAPRRTSITDCLVETRRGPHGRAPAAFAVRSLRCIYNEEVYSAAFAVSRPVRRAMRSSRNRTHAQQSERVRASVASAKSTPAACIFCWKERMTAYSMADSRAAADRRGGRVAAAAVGGAGVLLLSLLATVPRQTVAYPELVELTACPEHPVTEDVFPHHEGVVPDVGSSAFAAYIRQWPAHYFALPGSNTLHDGKKAPNQTPFLEVVAGYITGSEQRAAAASCTLLSFPRPTAPTNRRPN